MLFDFFKKKNYADAIFTNLKTITEDPELESCTWLSVKDGKIQVIGEGDTYADLQGKNTAVYDLGGRWVGPGLKKAFGNPSAAVLNHVFLKAEPSWDQEALLKAIEKYAKGQEKAGYCLIWNAGMELFQNASKEDQEASAEEAENTEAPAQETFTDKLDKASGGLPTIVMFEDGLSLRLNSAAVELVTLRADELHASTISPELALDAVISMDYAAQAEVFMKASFDLAARGVTAVCGTAENSYFDKLYRDLLINAISCNMLKQRFYGSYPLKRMVNPASVIFSANKAKTDCLELGGKMDYVSLTLECSGKEGSHNFFKEDYLKALSMDAGDKGYGMQIKALDQEAALLAIKVLGETSDAYKKLVYLVLHDQEIDEETRSQLYFGNCREMSLAAAEKTGDYASCTEEANRLMGLPLDWGTLTEGVPADLAVFDFDPRTVDSMNMVPAYMTILAGEPVYTRGTDTPEKWTAVMKEHLDSIAGDFAFEAPAEDGAQV